MNWTLEDTLLFLCCQGDSDGLGIKIDQTSQAINWSKLAAKAEREGLLPLLFHSMGQRHLLSYLPLSLQQSLSQEYYAAAAAAILRQTTLKEVLHSFKIAKLPIIVLKGAMLAELVYENPALRPMADIDILIRLGDVDNVHSLLISTGYSTNEDTPSPKEQRYLTTRCYFPENGGLPLHIHTHLINSSIPNECCIANLSMDTIWQQAVTVEIAGEECLLLAPHHQLLHLAEHSLRVSHSLKKMLYLCDIDRIIKHFGSSLNWQTLLEQPWCQGQQAFLYYPLLLAKKWLGTAVPDKILDRLYQPAGILEKIFSFLLRRNLRRPGLSYLLHLSLQPSLATKIPFVFRTIFPPRPVMALRCGIKETEIGIMTYIRRMLEIMVTLLWLLIQGLKETGRNSA